jgi:signal transduction histidine kinase
MLLPLLLFVFASWLSYRETQNLANERIERSLDVVEEQALKVFQSIALALDTIDERLANRSEAEIQADEARLHTRLRQIAAGLPEVQSIWIFGPTGHPQVMTREYPALASADYSAEDYFRVPRDDPHMGVYIGGIHQSVSGGMPYFTFSRARYSADGKFAGVIELSLLPSDFRNFYARLANSAGVQFALIREDGTMLARFPPLPAGAGRLDERSGFRRTISATPAGGFYTTSSEIDNIERRFGVRRIPDFPLYVSAGIETAQIRNEWMGGMAMHLIFGIPATAFLCGAVIVVLQRTKRLYGEQDRREAAESGMRQAQKMEAIGQLTGGIAHDFNNMLAIMLTSLDIALQRLANGDAAIEKLLLTAQGGGRRAASLVQRLLAFSRQQPLQPQSLDANKLVSEMSELLRHSLGETVKLETVLAGGLWRTNVDGNQLESAILNLAVNGRDAMSAGGKLTIETANTYFDDKYAAEHAVPAGQYVLIAVTDTGRGMPRDVMGQSL